MKTITIQSVEYHIPTSWESITLGRYLKIAKLNPDDTEEFKSLLIIEAYTDIPVVELKRMPLTGLHEITSIMQFIHTPIPEKPITDFVVDGERYYVTQNILEAEAQDFFTTESILSEASGDVLNAMPKLMAVLCKRDRETLDEININERQQLFLNKASIVQAMGIKVFFYNLATIYRLNLEFYSNREAILEAKLKEVESTIKRLNGMGYYGRFLEKTLQRFLKFYMQSWKISSSGTALNVKRKNIITTYKRLTKRKTTAG